MLMARLRVICPTPDEMEKLGQEMVQWCQENDPIHLSQWYTIHKGFTYNEWKNFIQREEFIPYYEIALKIVGLKYLAKDTNIEPSLKHRWARVYFKDLKEEEDDTAKFNSALKTMENTAIDPADKDRQETLISEIKGLRKAHESALNKDSTSNSADTKS